MNKKILSILVLILVFTFSTTALASLTFTTDAITGTTASSIDLGSGNDLYLQTSGGKVGIGITNPDSKLSVLDTPLSENTPAATITRLFSGIAPNPIVTFLLKNTGDISGGSDYQNEVHLRLQAGTTTNHRTYINFADYNGVDQWLTGRNAQNSYILYNATDVAHRLSMNSVANNGYTYLNSVGTGAVQINNGDGESTTLGSGGLEVFNGGMSPRTSIFRVAPLDDENTVLQATSNGVGYAPASLLLKATQASYRGQGVFSYNQPAQTSWFSGVPYIDGSSQWIVGYKPSASWDSTVAQPPYALFTILNSGNVGIGTNTPRSKLSVVGLPVYSNNGTALAGGLVAGDFYRTGGDPDLVGVVH